MDLPWECRDQEEQAEAAYNDPLRAKLKALEAELTKMRKLARTHGFSYSNGTLYRNGQALPDAGATDSTAQAGQIILTQQQGRSTRASVAEDNRPRLPHLPVEVLLRILQYAVTSSEPIIDPLSKLKREQLITKEKSRGNMIAIHFLATSKAYHVEGTRMLWANNTFTFTTAQALAHFADLSSSMRLQITNICLRITARYYDDVPDRKHWLDTGYHPALKKRIGLKVIPRLKEENLARKGFRSYSWNQVIDFLQALRAPYDPKHDKGADEMTPRPRLLPNLKSMRIDLVNFPEYFLQYPDNALHELAAHELGCTLNELIVTGIPRCEMGAKATNDFTGLVKDDGLYIDGHPSYVMYKNGLKALPPGNVHNVKVVRAWRAPVLKAAAAAAARRAKKASEAGASSNGSTALTAAALANNNHDSDSEDSDDSDDSHAHNHAKIRTTINMPPAPAETGHPKSTWKKRRTIWKRVPKNRDSTERSWIEFDRASGYPMTEVAVLGDSEDEDVLVCSKCGDLHEDDSLAADDFSHFDPFDLDTFGF